MPFATGKRGSNRALPSCLSSHHFLMGNPHGAASPDLMKIGKLDFERDCAPAHYRIYSVCQPYLVRT